jgi:hypothetical protein
MVNHKNALKRLWKGTFSVVEYQEKGKLNGVTGFEEVTVLENQPCRLSFSALRAADQQEMTAAVAQTAKLFCDNALTTKAGSKIIVQHAGRTLEYAQSGEPGIFTNHQEIVLVPFREWA